MKLSGADKLPLLHLTVSPQNEGMGMELYYKCYFIIYFFPSFMDR